MEKFDKGRIRTDVLLGVLLFVVTWGSRTKVKIRVYIWGLYHMSKYLLKTGSGGTEGNFGF